MARRFSDRPLLPYAVLAITPAVTLPLSVLILRSLPDCGNDEPWWNLGDFELALLPGLADLLPLAWLLSPVADVRRAGLTAGLLGAGRVAVPQALTLFYHFLTGGDGCSISVFHAVSLGVIMPALWAASVAASVLVFRRRSGTAAVRA